MEKTVTGTDALLLELYRCNKSLQADAYLIQEDKSNGRYDTHVWLLVKRHSHSHLPVPNPSRKQRVSQFLSECVVSKIRTVDLEGGLMKKRKEKWRLGKQVGDLQKKIPVLTQQLSAKELVLDVLTQEIETLTREHTEAA